MSDFPQTFVDDFHNLNLIKSMRYNQLGETGLKISLISFGGAHMSANVEFDETRSAPLNGYESAVETVKEAVKNGINYIDIAPLYGAGKAEIVMGK
ncbi:hypothetical protein B4U79_01782, partial [Dinothrombium tinctorium]